MIFRGEAECLVEALPGDAGDTPTEKVLMLSGGGQWGAYGAGLFKALHDASPDALAMKNVKVITGISTGSLQTLLLMVALDGNARKETRQYAIKRLEWGYSPRHESEVVDNRGMAQMLLRGARRQAPAHCVSASAMRSMKIAMRP